MKMNPHLSFMALALSLAYPAWSASPIFPFPPTPLNLQAKPADQVPPNVLFFIDNSKDSCRGAQNGYPCELISGRPLFGGETIFEVTKSVIEDITSMPKYQGYRFGAASYETGKSLSWYRGKYCGVSSNYITEFGGFDSLYNGNKDFRGYKNWRISPCWEERKAEGLAVGLLWRNLPIEESGAIIYAPITSDSAKFKSGLDKIKGFRLKYSWGYASLSSAYLELTRYYRGLSSGTDKHLRKLGDSSRAWTQDATKQEEVYLSPIEYRCQSNNIVFLNSAENVWTSLPQRDVKPFYKAFHEDPLYRHDHDQYSLDNIDGKPIYFKATGDARLPTLPNHEKYKAVFGYHWPLTPLRDKTFVVKQIPNDQTNANIRYNPFFDHLVTLPQGTPFKDGGSLTEDSKAIDFLQYHEKRSIEGFAHLAFVGEILKNKEGKKILNGQEVDKEGKRWDGTSAFDTSRNSHQNIRTFTVNYQLGLEDFQAIKIKKVNRVIFNSMIILHEKPKQVIATGDCVYYNGQPLKDKKGRIVRTNTGEATTITNHIWFSGVMPDYIGAGSEIKIVSKKQVKNTQTCEFKDASDTQAASLLQATGNKGGGGFSSVSGGAAGLKKTLEHILDQIAAAPSYTPVGGSLASNDNKVSTAITSTLDTRDWSSELRFYTLDKEGRFDLKNPVKPEYPESAKTLISIEGGVYSLDKDNKAVFNNTLFNIGNPLKNKEIDHFGLTGLKVATSERSDEWSRLIQWLLRQTKTDNDPIFQGNLYQGTTQFIYRKRSKDGRYLGDVLDSNILSFGGEQLDNQDNKKHPYITVGSNDGMLHIYHADNPNSAYQHTLAYIPGMAKRTNEKNTVVRNLVYTAEQNYGSKDNPHQYFVNGGQFYRKTDSGVYTKVKGKWTYQNPDDGQMMLVSSLGQGGRAALSLSIGGTQYGSNEKTGLDATQDSWNESVPLWDSSNPKVGNAYQVEEEGSLGYPIGRPQIGRVSIDGLKDVRYATFLNNGLDSTSLPTLFVLDQLGKNAAPNLEDHTPTQAPGSLLKAIDAGDNAGDLAAPVFVDYDRDGISDLVYAGDSNGNMWRFDLREKPDEWKAKMIFKGDPKKPITVAPDIYYEGSGKGGRKKVGDKYQYTDPKEYKIYVLFGTGSAIYQNDFRSTDVQSVYGIIDNLNCTADSTDLACQTAQTSDLLEQKIKEQKEDSFISIGTDGLSAKKPYRIVSSNDMSKEHKGWYLDLIYNDLREGERVIVSPTVIAGSKRKSGSVFFTTRTFKDSNNLSNGNPSCTAPAIEIGSWVMALDVKSGGNPNKINLNRTVDNTNIAAFYEEGAASGFHVPSRGLEINEHGRGSDGIAMPLSTSPFAEIVPTRTICQSGVANTAITIQNTSTPTGQDPKEDNKSDIVHFTINCAEGENFRRIGWREIF